MKNYLFIFLNILSLLLVQCRNKEDSFTSLTLSDTNNNAVYPQIALNHLGQPYVWWTEETEEKNSIVVYTVSSDKGKTFSRSSSIPVTLGCSDGHGQGMPQLIFKKDGTMIIVFSVKKPTEKNRFAGSILYSQSFDQGKNWTEPLRLHSDSLPDNGHAFPALTNTPDGEVAAVWLDGRGKLPHSELYMAVTEGRDGFGPDRKTGGPACQCCRLDFYTDDKDIMHILYRGIMEDNIRDIMLISSSDVGKTFSDPERISPDNWQIKGCPHAGPSMTRMNDQLYFSWFTSGSGQGVFCCKKDLSTGKFSPREATGDSLNARHPHIASSNGTAALVWEEKVNDPSSYNTRIALKIFTENSSGPTMYLTGENSRASYPYLIFTENGRVLVTWNETKDEKEIVKVAEVGG